MQHEEGGKSICREEFVFVFEIISFGIRRLIATQREIDFSIASITATLVTVIPGKSETFIHPCVDSLVVEYARWKKIGLFFIFVLLFFFFIVNWKKIMENSRWRLVGNLLLVNGMIEQLIARNYSVLYAYKARQRLNRLFMISKFIFCVSFFLFYTIRCDMRIILFLRNLFFLLFINQFEIVVIVSR